MQVPFCGIVGAAKRQLIPQLEAHRHWRRDFRELAYCGVKSNYSAAGKTGERLDVLGKPENVLQASPVDVNSKLIGGASSARWCWQDEAKICPIPGKAGFKVL